MPGKYLEEQFFVKLSGLCKALRQKPDVLKNKREANLFVIQIVSKEAVVDDYKRDGSNYEKPNHP